MRRGFIKNIIQKAIDFINEMIDDTAQKLSSNEYIKNETQREIESLKDMREKLYTHLSMVDNASAEEIKKIERFLTKVFIKLKKDIFN
jgi:phosphoserine phosphatase